MVDCLFTTQGQSRKKPALILPSGTRNKDIHSSLVLSIIIYILMAIIPPFSTALPLMGLLPIILIIFGIIGAYNEALKPVPIIGKLFVGKFNLGLDEWI